VLPRVAAAAVAGGPAARSEVLPKPQPDPGPIKLDEHVLAHAARVIDAKAVAKLREVSLLKRPGPVMTKVDPAMARAAFPQRTRRR
jgi:hypothetical protein